MWVGDKHTCPAEGGEGAPGSPRERRLQDPARKVPRKQAFVETQKSNRPTPPTHQFLPSLPIPPLNPQDHVAPSSPCFHINLAPPDSETRRSGSGRLVWVLGRQAGARPLRFKPPPMGPQASISCCTLETLKPGCGGGPWAKGRSAELSGIPWEGQVLAFRVPALLEVVLVPDCTCYLWGGEEGKGGRKALSQL